MENNKNEIDRKEKEKREWKIAIKVMWICLLVCILIFIWTIVDKNNMYHININNPNLIKTEDGYTETLTIDETTVTSKRIEFNVGIGRIKKNYYYIEYYNEELQEYMSVDVGKTRYNDFEIGDKVKVTRIVYYTKNGFRIDSKDFMEKIEE